MRTVISRWFLFGLLVGWALTHAAVFAQEKETGKAVSKTPADPLEKLRANLAKTVTLDYTGNSLTEVLNHIREKTGVAINIDQVALMQVGIDVVNGLNPGAPMQQVSVKATNEKVSQVLRKLLGSHQLAYVILDEAVLVTTEDVAVSRQMRQRVSVNVEDVPFNKAVRSLAKAHGVNLVIDPKVAKDAETAVTLQLEDAALETSVRLLAELANLKSVRMGNVLFITTEAKAAKIRAEEPNPLDGLNPNMPIPPVIRGNLAGGIGFGGMMGGAGIGGPARPVPVQAIPKVFPQGGPPPGIVPPRPANPALPANPPPLNDPLPPPPKKTAPAVGDLPPPPPPPPVIERRR
jgi:hypothetical protein